MTLDDLIETLNDYRETHGGDTEVRMMTQPNWPFEWTICGAVSTEDIKRAIDDDVDDDGSSDRYQSNEPVVIYILEGSQLGYGTKLAWEATG